MNFNREVLVNTPLLNKYLLFSFYIAPEDVTKKPRDASEIRCTGRTCLWLLVGKYFFQNFGQGTAHYGRT